MSELNFSLLEQLPEGVVSLEAEVVTAVNAQARAFLPGLEPGQHITQTPFPPSVPTGSGTFQYKEARFRFTASSEGGQRLIFFSPEESRPAIPTDELLFYLRQCISPMMAELSAQEDPDCAAIKGLHGMVRTFNNIQLLTRTEQPEKQVPVEFVSLCRRVTTEADGLLTQRQVQLRFECRLPSLLLSGDPDLLERLLLELIANSVKVTPPGGEVLFRLTHSGRQARLTVRDGGSQRDGARLMAAMGGQGRDLLPRPDQGASLGLAVAQHIARLHRGSLMAAGGPEGHSVILSLPTSSGAPSVTMRTPAFVQSDGGLSPLLLGLCDVLPTPLFDRSTIL